MRREIVTIVGRPNVGKSTLFNRITKSRSSITEDTPGVTRDRLYRKAEWLNKPFLLVDTGGLDAKSEDNFMNDIYEQAEVAIKSSSCVIFIVDGKSGITPTDRSILNMLRKFNSNIVLAVNKIDAKDAEENLYDFYEFGIEKMVPISAEHGIGIGDLLDEVVSFFPEEIVTPDRDDEIKRCMVYGSLGKRVRANDYRLRAGRVE